jgi:hypothetical protein
MDHVEMDRRTVIKTAGAGLALVLAGLKGTDILAADAVCASDKKLGVTRAQFHHIGVPTQIKHEEERFLEGGKVYITDPEKSAYRIEWCRWMPESKEPEIIRTTAHIAFQVDDVEAEIKKYDEKMVFAKPYVPFAGVKVGFVNVEGLLVEFLQKI